MTNPHFRTARGDEVPLVLSWAKVEGWNPGLDDAAAFFATDPEGFFVAEVAGAPVAAISVVNHGSEIAFLGLYLCLPAFRGRGIGYGLWQYALTHAGARVVGLDGVPDQQENYRKSGFDLVGSTYRYEGSVTPADASALRPFATEDLASLSALDAEATGYAKRDFLAAWLPGTPDRETYVLEEDHVIKGFATIRRCTHGAKIGPFTAQDMASAETLLRGLSALWPDRPLILDVPEDQTQLTQFCLSEGMEAAFNTARMYRGQAPEPGALISSAGTLELG